MRLAARLVADFHGEEAAAERRGGVRAALRRGRGGRERRDGRRSPSRSTRAIASVLVARGARAESKNVARQKIREGAVAVSDDGRSWKKVENPADDFTFGPDGTRLVRLGKRFVRLARG